MKAGRWKMIEDKSLERCYGMLGNKDVKSYLCIVRTYDEQTGFDTVASIDDMTLMLANAALIDPKFLIALNVAYASVRQYLLEQEGGGNNK